MANEVEIHVKVIQDGDLDRVAAKTRTSFQGAAKDIKTSMGGAAREIVKDMDKAGRASKKEFAKSITELRKVMGAVGEVSMQDFVRNVRKMQPQAVGEVRRFGKALTEDLQRSMVLSRGLSGQTSMREFIRSIKQSDTWIAGEYSKLGRNAGNHFAKAVADDKSALSLNKSMARLATFSFHGFKAGLRGALEKGGPSLSGPILGAMAAAVAAVMPLVGAAASGLFVTAFGLGLAGMFGAFSFQTERVQKRWQEFTEYMSSTFKDISTPFQQTWIDSLSILSNALREVEGDLRDAAEILGPATTELVRGLAGAMKELANVTPAISRGFAAITDELGPQLPEMFREIAGAIARVSQSIQDNPDTFVMLIRWIGHLTSDLLELIATLNDVAGWFEEHPVFTESLIMALKATTAPAMLAKDAIEALKGAWRALRGPVKSSWIELNKSTNAIDENTKALIENAEQLRRQYDPTFDLIKAQEDLHNAHSAYDKAVKKHGPNSEQARAALMRMAKAAIALQIATGQAAGTFNGKLSPSMRATLRAAGLSTKEINRLEKEFRDAHAAGKKFARTYTATIKTIYHDVYRTTGQRVAGRTGRGGHSEYASGGNIKAAATGGMRDSDVVVGEEGPEIVELPFGSRVIPAGESRRRMQAGSRAGAESLRLEVVSDGTDFGEMLVKLISKHVRLRYQGQVVKALGGSA